MSAPAVKRTRYAHGIALPRVADGRTLAARRFRALVNQFADDLGGGDLSAVDQALVTQAAHLMLEAEALQAASIAGNRADPDTLVRLNSEARRVLAQLQARAAKARASTAGPSIDDLFAVNAAEDGVE